MESSRHGQVLPPLIHLLASATHRELVAQIQYLKAENEILRSKLPRRVPVTDAEKARLMKLELLVGPALKHLISIVSPKTFTQWASGAKANPGEPRRKPGRPRTPEEIAELILRIARETGWGYTRILGELKKLGIRNVSRTTVKNILIAHGFDPGPTRGEGSWDQFLKIHAQTLWACDFLSKKIWTKHGLVDYFVLIFIHIAARRVIATPRTAHPTEDWVTQQARNVLMEVDDARMQLTDLIHDWDTKFTARFDAIIESQGGRVHRKGPAQPNMNPHVERWIQSCQQECLDHFVVLGEKHFNHLIKEYRH